MPTCVKLVHSYWHADLALSISSVMLLHVERRPGRRERCRLLGLWAEYYSAMRILIVEDETKAAANLAQGLRERGFAVDISGNGQDGLHLAITEEYAIVVLDVMLPIRDGWSVLTEMRRAGKQTPVLFLTAKDRIQDRVQGLELGADDYLVKPFAFAELLARMHSILRRGPQRQPDVIRVGDLEVDTVRHRTIRANRVLELTPKEFTLLAMLARRAGEVVSRTQISEQVWDINFDSFTNVVDVHVSRLRSKVDDPFEKKMIRTIRGIGYILEKPS
jgi:two-component system copper resistance phosphate regulon response regulator CusR